MKILVINSGSSSLKFQIYEVLGLAVLATGTIEQIGEPLGLARICLAHESGTGGETERRSHISDHRAAIQLMIELIQERQLLDDIRELAAVGHRVVHGGESFHEPALITEEVLAGIKDLVPLAPLHNPANITGIELILEMFPQVPQVAVFDTSFHQGIPDYAFLYAIPYRLYEEQKIRRYGFHGTSHSSVSKAAAAYLRRPIAELKIISLHLGNGASVAAIDKGCCIDTSMGLTPLEGLIMGTRCGDLDPAIPFYLARVTGMRLDEIEHLLNKESGLKGICGKNDMRAIGVAAAAGDLLARLAFEMFCYRLKKYVGSYLAVLGGVDCLIFTGGIGENDPKVRARTLEGLAPLGLILDPHKNNQERDGILAIQGEGGLCDILVIATNEELEIASQTLALIA